jgi:conjugal transfer pilus assembly protein TraV
MNTRTSTRASHSIMLTAGLCLSLTGCMSLSGLGGSTDYACKAPDGVTCDSVSGTYANAVQNNLPSQRMKRRAASKIGVVSGEAVDASTLTNSRASTRLASPAALTTPLRSSARILRLWFKPWEDADHDLYDQGYVYVQIDAGQWLIDYAQREIRNAYTPLRPPIKTTPAGQPTPPGPQMEPSSSLPGSAPYQRPSPDTGPLLPPVDNPTDATN